MDGAFGPDKRASILATALVMPALPSVPTGKECDLDVLGAVLFVVATCCLLIAPGWIGFGTVHAAMSILLLAAPIAAFAALVMVERRAVRPVLPIGPFRSRIFPITVLVVVLVAMAVFWAAIFLPLMFQLLLVSAR